MTDMRLLFICNQNENRSLTAHRMFEERSDCEIRSAGLYSTETPVTGRILQWADAIIVFEERHVLWLKEDYPQIWFDKRVIDIDIPDRYRYMDEELRELILSRMEDWWSTLGLEPGRM